MDDRFLNKVILVLIVMAVFMVSCAKSLPETEPPVVEEDVQIVIPEEEPSQIIQEYPLVTTADLEWLEAQKEALDKGQEIEEQALMEEAEDFSAVYEAESECSADTWQEEAEWVDEDTWEDIEEGIEMIDAEEEESGMAYLGNYQITAYEWTGYPCANGNYPTEGYTVACNSLPFGTVVYIEGVGYRTVEDRGADWHSNQWIDLYLGNVDECFRWGVQYLDVWVVE